MFTTIFKDVAKNYGRKIFGAILALLILLLLASSVYNGFFGKKALKEKIENQTEIINALEQANAEAARQQKIEREATLAAEKAAKEHDEKQKQTAEEFDNISNTLEKELALIQEEALKEHESKDATVKGATPAFTPPPILNQPTKIVKPKAPKVPLKVVEDETTATAELKRQQKVVTSVNSAIEQAYLKATQQAKKT